MKARPILFSGDMVRALLDGRKTMTRRIVKLPDGDVRNVQYWSPPSGRSQDGWCHPGVNYHLYGNDGELVGNRVDRCPHGEPGDLLYVKETFSIPDAPYDQKNADLLNYRATPGAQPGKWRPSIHMPRWASRITLEITDVRVERLRDITRADAISEGVDWKKCPQHQTQESLHAQIAADRIGMAAHPVMEIDYVGGFRRLWKSINGPESWDKNPWVWCIAFNVHKMNVNDYIRQLGD